MITISSASAPLAAIWGHSLNRNSKATQSASPSSSFSAELLNGAYSRQVHIDTKKDPFVQFEAVFLRNFVESMLPKDNSGVFGTGSAGEYWRSIMAEEIANAIAVNGKTGIATTLRQSLEKI